MEKIDYGLYYNIINNADTILISGYADYIGTSTYNDVLSQKRADNVKEYLISMGIHPDNVITCIGKGEVSRDIELPEGYRSDRRVDIISLKNKTSIPAPAKTIPPEKDIIDLPPMEQISFTKITDLIEVRVGQLLVLDRIFFYTGLHIVAEESLPELDKLFLSLERNPDIKIRIEGHVCCVHPSVDALDEGTGEIALSVNRAKAIYNYLVKKGIDAERLSYIGFGKSRPLRPKEITDEDRDMNKRVEIRILEK